MALLQNPEYITTFEFIVVNKSVHFSKYKINKEFWAPFLKAAGP